MKKVRALLLLSVIISLTSLQLAQAQEAGDIILNLNYSPSFPLGGFKTNIIDKTSWKGYAGDIIYHVANKWAVGIDFSYQGYEERTPSATFTLSSSEEVNGVLNTRMNFYPILVKGQFYPFGGTNALVRPYI